MRSETTSIVALGVWAIGLVPAALLVQWFGVVGSTFGGFFTAYIVLAFIILTFDMAPRWIGRRWRGKADKNGAAPKSER